MLPTLSHLSVSISPGGRLRHWCSFLYLRISPLHRKFHHPLPYSSQSVLNAVPRLSLGISHPTHQSAYTRFTPSNSEQRLHPLSYRGCWHRVSRCFLSLWSGGTLFTFRGSYSVTAVYNPKAFILHAVSLRQAFAHCGRSSTAASRRSLGSSQSQCRRSASQPAYPSSPW